MEDIHVIDLAVFGGEGNIEVGPQTLAMKVAMKNELGKRAKVRMVDGEQILEYQDIGDVEIIKALAYVRSAPFPRTVKGFLSYCDMLDGKKVGMGEALLAEIQKVAAEVISSPGPLED